MASGKFYQTFKEKKKNDSNCSQSLLESRREGNTSHEGSITWMPKSKILQRKGKYKTSDKHRYKKKLSLKYQQTRQSIKRITPID